MLASTATSSSLYRVPNKRTTDKNNNKWPRRYSTASPWELPVIIMIVSSSLCKTVLKRISNIHVKPESHGCNHLNHLFCVCNRCHCHHLLFVCSICFACRYLRIVLDLNGHIWMTHGSDDDDDRRVVVNMREANVVISTRELCTLWHLCNNFNVPNLLCCSAKDEACHSRDCVLLCYAFQNSLRPITARPHCLAFIIRILQFSSYHGNWNGTRHKCI